MGLSRSRELKLIFSVSRVFKKSSDVHLESDSASCRPYDVNISFPLDAFSLARKHLRFGALVIVGNSIALIQNILCKWSFVFDEREKPLACNGCFAIVNNFTERWKICVFERELFVIELNARLLSFPRSKRFAV